MYSPEALPSRMRAAPAKKRRLSAQTGISSLAYESGLPTFTDSSSASSSVCSSIASASFSSASARSPGVVSSHSGSAFFAASTARSTSPSVPLGTSAIASPVAGLMTSIVPPSTASTHSPPTKFFRWETVTLIENLPVYVRRTLSLAGQPGLLGQPLGDHDRDDRQHDHEEDDGVHDRQVLPTLDLVENEDRQRLLEARGERGHDHLVKRERERQQPTRDERRREHRPDDEAERLPAVGAEVHRGLQERRRRPPQARKHVVVDEHHAERRVPDHDRPDREPHPGEGVEGVQRHPGDDSGQRDRQDQQERDRLAPEEAEAVDRERGGSPEHERDPGRQQPDLQREPERRADVLVVPGVPEPVERVRRDRPALDRRAVEGVEHDDQQRDPEERDDEEGRQTQSDPDRSRLHQSASNAPSRRAIMR